MEKIDGKTFKTEKGHEVSFQFDLIPSDQKWVAYMSGELNNAATYFSSSADVNQTTKETRGGSIGKETTAAWKPWDYQDRLKNAEKVACYEKTLKNLSGKDRSRVTAFIEKQVSRQEYEPPLGKYVDLIKAGPLHNMNNACQHWFTFLIVIAMQYTPPGLLECATALTDLPKISTIVMFMKCVKNTVKCGRLY